MSSGASARSAKALEHGQAREWASAMASATANAERHRRLATEALEATLGANHPETLSALSRLSVLLREQGRRVKPKTKMPEFRQHMDDFLDGGQTDTCLPFHIRYEQWKNFHRLFLGEQ